jgi:hypothetical protein
MKAAPLKGNIETPADIICGSIDHRATGALSPGTIERRLHD